MEQSTDNRRSAPVPLAKMFETRGGHGKVWFVGRMGNCRIRLVPSGERGPTGQWLWHLVVEPGPEKWGPMPVIDEAVS
jgi:hypothetical protein